MGHEYGSSQWLEIFEKTTQIVPSGQSSVEASSSRSIHHSRRMTSAGLARTPGCDSQDALLIAMNRKLGSNTILAVSKSQDGKGRCLYSICGRPLSDQDASVSMSPNRGESKVYSPRKQN